MNEFEISDTPIELSRACGIKTQLEVLAESRELLGADLVGLCNIGQVATLGIRRSIAKVIVKKIQCNRDSGKF